MFRSQSAVTILLVLGGTALPSGCARTPLPVQMSVLSIVANGRTVNATVPAPSVIQREGESIVVTSGKHKIVIERGRIVLDGAELVTIPESTTSIQLWISETGLLTMNRDGMALATKQL